MSPALPRHAARAGRACLTLVLVLLAGGTASSARADGSWSSPLEGHTIDRSYAAPPGPYAAGHRGIDLTGAPGEAVRAVAAGTVAFVGEVAGTPVVTVSHGSERSTYQPVLAAVEVGRSVDAGQVIGTLLPGHAGCGAAACLHLGRIEGETYLNPAEMFGGRYRLISPEGPPPAPPALGTGELRPPLTAPVTSGFGLRIHPITGEPRAHDGIDFGAPCGSPVTAAAAGRVASVSRAGGFGLRVEIDHGGGRVTSYSHLSSAGVAPGATVAAGDTVARVGTTGTSTGCHLHFSVHDHGRAVDPAPLL
ncbi:peptidoglycan DD-metalloendopeptidase family protein [Aeromicrobium sp. Sec7.5]|uniref:peptidoglycan DD-metalloendopeptidase family protein n=1 Tax=Aeromicrobium sp. Sec7.5 TaxID=3121276 RepID=UPI002FE4AEA6